jgi:hypothetical protein
VSLPSQLCYRRRRASGLVLTTMTDCLRACLSG